MNKQKFGPVVFAILAATFLVFSVFSQKAKPTPAGKAVKPIIFAVLQDGTNVEPIASINSGKLEPTVTESDYRTVIAAFVGSYWIEIDKLTRGLLFFIADKGGDGKYSFGYSEYRSVDQASVMSGEIKSIDDGVLHELLLDSFDYDGDGKGEIFTYTQSFEGAGF